VKCANIGILFVVFVTHIPRLLRKVAINDQVIVNPVKDRISDNLLCVRLLRPPHRILSGASWRRLFRLTFDSNARTVFISQYSVRLTFNSDLVPSMIDSFYLFRESLPFRVPSAVHFFALNGKWRWFSDHPVVMLFDEQ